MSITVLFFKLCLFKFLKSFKLLNNFPHTFTNFIKMFHLKEGRRYRHASIAFIESEIFIKVKTQKCIVSTVCWVNKQAFEKYRFLLNLLLYLLYHDENKISLIS
jgi:hypothetical protein